MQSFVVVSKVNGTLTLKASITETTVTEGKTLRSAQANTPEKTLQISAIRGKDVSKALLLYRENTSHKYIPEEDSYKLFSENDSVSIGIYTRSSDGYALDINSIGNLEQSVPVGIRTKNPGEILLKFSGMESFDDQTVIQLLDNWTGLSVNLSEKDEYSFDKTGSDLHLEGRFTLLFTKAMDIRSTTAASTILMQQLAPQTVRIVTDNGSPLGIYIVRVNGETRKLRIRN